MFFFNFTQNIKTQKILWEPINQFDRLDVQETFTQPKLLLPQAFEV